MSSESSLKEMVEKSWQEIQSSFGSSTSVNGQISIPVNSLTADMGGSFVNVVTNDNANRNRQEKFSRSSSL